jgi:hypothetical protein
MSKENLDKSAQAEQTELADNAFRELAEGEEYRPLMHPDRPYAEVTPYSVTMGLIMAVIFSAAAAYLGLKIGQVFEAAIPIAIIAVGVSGALKKKDALGQNVIIQSIGACSGVIVAGAIFTLPALYILQATHPDITAVWRRIGYFVLHPLPQIFCEGYARQISFPGSNSHNSSFG